MREDLSPCLATSPNVQKAGEQLAGATVSQDEVTIQPDFYYDDSELSDDDTGIVSPVQPTLPSKVKFSKVHICGDGSVTPLLALYILHCMIFYSIPGTMY